MITPLQLFGAEFATKAHRRADLEYGWRARMERQFEVVIERDEEGYYVASVPQLPGCHTQARSLDKVTARWSLCAWKWREVPEQKLEFIAVQRITIAA